MSKMGQAIYEMQEDAMEMSREEFVKKYGKANADVYDELYKNNEEPYVYPGGDCQV